MAPSNGSPDIAERFADRLMELVEKQQGELREFVREELKELGGKHDKLSDRLLALEQQSPRPGKQLMSGGVAGATVVTLVEAFRQIFGGGL